MTTTMNTVMPNTIANATGDDMIQLGELTILPQDAVITGNTEPGLGVEVGSAPVVPETVTVTLTQSPGDGKKTDFLDEFDFKHILEGHALTLNLLELKALGLCQQYRDRPACTSVQFD